MPGETALTRTGASSLASWLTANATAPLVMPVTTRPGVGFHAQNSSDSETALRGGKGNFAVVTALEFDLFPVSRLYGGGIYFPGERMADVLRAWTAWHADMPETMTSSFAAMRVPALPEYPNRWAVCSWCR